jgi:hypothetical protein
MKWREWLSWLSPWVLVVLAVAALYIQQLQHQRRTRELEMFVSTYQRVEAPLRLQVTQMTTDTVKQMVNQSERVVKVVEGQQGSQMQLLHAVESVYERLRRLECGLPPEQRQEPRPRSEKVFLSQKK